MNIEALYKIYQQHPHIQTDSRKIAAGDLYFALKGGNFDGNNFAAQALQDGAAYAIVDDPTVVASDKYILVDDVLSTLQHLATHHRKQFNIPFIAITGTNGKTTTKELAYQVLSSSFRTYATEGNLNNHIGVPLTLLKIRPDAEMAIIEMGANHEKEIAFYCGIAQPNYAIINNVGKAHLEGFGSLEGVRRAKGELYDYIRQTNGTIFINADLYYLQEMAQGITKQVRYGSANASVLGRVISGGPCLQFAVLSSGMETLIQTQLVGDYNFPNAMAAVAVGHHFGISVDKIKTALEAYSPSNSRSQLIQKGNITIIMDAYNANPTSMKLAIDNLAAMQTEKEKWLLLGAMKEMGENCKQEHEALVQLAQAHGFTNVILVGKEFEQVQHNYRYFETAAAAGEWLAAHLPDNAIMLVKGSRGSKMEDTLQI